MQNTTTKFITLGCRVNQYETQGMREALEQAGLSRQSKPEAVMQAPEEVGLVVINSCTVTQEADRETRYWIRRSKRDYPQAKIVVTGCGVQRDKSKIAAMDEVDVALGNDEKNRIADYLAQSCSDPDIQSGSFKASNTKQDKWTYSSLPITHSAGHTRAFIKIQDGCNHACSFCKVVLVRGRSRSRSAAEILDEVKRLRDAGYRDIVLTGIQLGAYGLDFGSSKNELPELMHAIAKISGIERIRLSSIEPTDVHHALIEAIQSIPQCAPHLHIPLQSGSNEILQKMNRRYDRSFYRALISKLRESIPDWMLTLDVMSGFPGEDEQHHQDTLQFIREVKPLKCHVFPYSKREGTKASMFQSEISGSVTKNRVRELLELSDAMGMESMTAYQGQTRSVLVEGVKTRTSLSDMPNHPIVALQGLTDNFIRVEFQGDSAWVGQTRKVRLLEVQPQIMKAVSEEKET